jgi:uncharacterized integral membrane protein
MRKFLNALVLIPLGVIFLVFAVANRHEVTVSFDPFNSSDPALGFRLPLFVIIIAAVILGVVAGGSATWFGQRRWRRAARHHEADARDLRAQLANWQGGAMSTPQAAPPQNALPGSVHRRDKQGATM